MTTQLTTIDTDHIDPVALLARADLADSTRIKYHAALTRYLDTGNTLFDASGLALYADGISDTEKRYLSAVVSLWAKEHATDVKSRSTPETVDTVVATIHRLDALKEVVKAPEPKGDKTHTWLTLGQVKAIANEIGNSIVGARDRVAIGLLVAAGLRREEAVTLRWSDIKWQPYGDKVRTVLAVTGKGAKGRTVPISDTLANDLDVWAEYTGREGLVLRSLGRNTVPGKSMSAVALFKLERKYATRIDRLPDSLAPHDLRRTYARIAYDNGVDIGQVSILLGHESIETTQNYLGIEIDLSVTASDFIPW